MSEIQIRPIKPLNPSVLLNSFRIIRSGNMSLGKVEFWTLTTRQMQMLEIVHLHRRTLLWI